MSEVRQELPVMQLHSAHIDGASGCIHPFPPEAHAHLVGLTASSSESSGSSGSSGSAGTSSGAPVFVSLDADMLVIHHGDEPTKVLLTLADVSVGYCRISNSPVVSIIVYPECEDVVCFPIDPRICVHSDDVEMFRCCGCARENLTGGRWSCPKTQRHVCTNCRPLDKQLAMWLVVVKGDHGDVQRALRSLSAVGVLRREIHQEYKISQREIGQGCYARVFRAHIRSDRASRSSLQTRALGRYRAGCSSADSCASSDPGPGSELVVKVLNHSESPEKRARQCELLMFEIAALVILRGHPNVVAFSGIFVDAERPTNQGYDPRFMLAMEWCPGGDLTKVLSQGRAAFHEDRGTAVMCDILAGLAHVHAHGLIHRDVKPENILIAGDGRAVLADFGMACFEHDTYEVSKRVGSPGCCAPEVILGDPYGCKVDVFSAGCALFFMLSGQFPFFGLSVQSTLIKTVEDELSFDDTKMFQFVSDGCKELIAACLEKKPESRMTAEEAFDTAQCVFDAACKTQENRAILYEDSEDGKSLHAFDHSASNSDGQDSGDSNMRMPHRISMAQFGYSFDDDEASDEGVQKGPLQYSPPVNTVTPIQDVNTTRGLCATLGSVHSNLEKINASSSSDDDRSTYAGQSARSTFNCDSTMWHISQGTPTSMSTKTFTNMTDTGGSSRVGTNLSLGPFTPAAPPSPKAPPKSVKQASMPSWLQERRISETTPMC